VPSLRRVAHRAIAAAVSGFNRNPWTSEALELMPRRAGPLYDQDGLRTTHNHTFAQAPEFERAYRRAVQAAGWDYEIHWRVHVILWAARTAWPLPGAFVECGTGRGFMASAICQNLGWDHRPFFLFDTFEPGSVRPHGSKRDITRSPYYADGPDGVRENFREWPGVQLVLGAVPDSLGEVDVGSVAFLHIDMNDPVPESAALRHFWPILVSGGVIVLDDYAYRGFEDSHRSADRVAADLGFYILSLPTGQGLAIKPARVP
jgi:hypothetical protein